MPDGNLLTQEALGEIEYAIPFHRDADYTILRISEATNAGGDYYIELGNFLI